jgi:hypothetical protein
MKTKACIGQAFRGFAAAWVLLAFAAPVAFSAQYYVDFQGGSDTNPGTSIAQPWKHCPGDTGATAVVASKQLAAGDTVNFKGGVVYVGTLNVNWSGTQPAPVTYEGSPAGWGSGKAIIDGNLVRSSAFYTSSSRSNVTIRSFELRNMAPGDSKAIKFQHSSGFTRIIIEKCYIHDCGSWQQEAPTVQGGGIMLYRPIACIVRDNEITRTGSSGIFMVGGSGSTVVGNHVHDYINWCIGASSETGMDLAGLVIASNRLHDFYYYDVGFRQTTSNRPHSNGIFIYRGSGGSVANVTVEGNFIYNDIVFTNSAGSYMINTSVANTGLKVINNVLINPHSYYALGLRDDSGGSVYNNTVYAPRCTPLLLDKTAGAFDLKNNIFVGNQSVVVWTQPADALFTCDYNAFAYDGGSSFAKQNSPYLSFTYLTFRLAFPLKEINGLGPLPVLDFVSTDGYPTNCAAMDLRLRADSPCVGAGADLSSLFAADFRGVLRPVGGAWDIGAHEWGAAAVPMPPANLRVLP